jgi:N-acetyl-anhydromuramyl-L-alanine amidase AmpD
VAAVFAVLAMMAGYASRAGSSVARASSPGLVLSGRAEANTLLADFGRAAKEFGVPESVLLAVGYQESLWESHGGHPSVTGSYNVMGLTHLSPSDVETLSAAQRQAVFGQRGKRGQAFSPSAATLALVNRVRPHDPALHTLDAAAALIHQPLAALGTSMRQSVRGGAALLAYYERAALGRLPAGPGQWYAAVARYSEATDARGAQLFADRVYTVIRGGAARTTSDGQTVTLPPDPSVRPDTSQVSDTTAGASTFAAECPSGLNCVVKPAAYQANPDGSYGNYDVANRPADGDAIRYIVIHDTEGSYSGTISAFQNSTTEASAHYVVQSSTGAVTQMVQTKDIAWHAGNWYVNMHAVGIENEGYALQGATWYTPSEYQSSAALVKYLAARFSIPLDRQHIIGHDDVPGPAQSYVAGMHWDPGPYWDWNYFMKLAGAPVKQPDAGSLPVGSEITIDPPFTSSNEPTVTGCTTSSGSITTCPKQPANFVYLRTSPSSTAPLLSDPSLHPDGSAGTTLAWDWGDKAVSGQTFVVAGENGSWTAIWYAGQKAWFYNPDGQNAAPATRTVQSVVTPSGSTAVPVYGRAYPESSAYPAGVTQQKVTPLNYSIQPGQAYVPDAAVYGDYADTNFNTAEVMVIGTTQYYPIRFNHRLAYVMASQVELVPAALPPAYTPVGPLRVLDTRNGTGGYSAPVGAGQTISLQVTGQDGVPSAGVTAVALNVSALNATQGSYVTVYADGTSRPAAENLIFKAGERFTRLVVVPVVDGKVDFYNRAGTVNLLADLAGYYGTAGGAWFDGIGPARILDTRNGAGGYSAPVGAGQTISLQVTGKNGVPPSGVTTVVLNVTAVNPTKSSYVTVYPDGMTRPGTSNLDFTAGETFPNLVVVRVIDGKIDFYNHAGSVNLVADLAGYCMK